MSKTKRDEFLEILDFVETLLDATDVPDDTPDEYLKNYVLYASSSRKHPGEVMLEIKSYPEETPLVCMVLDRRGVAKLFSDLMTCIEKYEDNALVDDSKIQ
jgi:hypothetical protein